MCGLVGAFGTLNHKEKKVFRDLLHFDVVRGDHSTGIYCYNLDADKFHGNLMKHEGVPYKLYESEKHSKEFDDNNIYKGRTHLMLGHNRYATQGAINADNAHPFEFENLVGAHNGTVDQWSMKSFFESDKYVIDSQMIYSEISHNDNDPTSVFKDANGAFALTWWDKTREELNFARNEERPLYYVVVKDGQTLFWASEMWMLQVALSRHGVNYVKISKLPTSKNMIFSLDKGKIKEEEWDLPENTYTRFPPSTYNYGSNYYGYNNHNSYKKEEVKLVLSEFHKTGKLPHEGQFFGTTEDGKEVVVKLSFMRPEDDYKRLMGILDKDPETIFSVDKNEIIWSVGLKCNFCFVRHLEEVTENTEEENDILARLANKCIYGKPLKITEADFKSLDGICEMCLGKVHYESVQNMEDFVFNDIGSPSKICVCGSCISTGYYSEN